MKLKGRYIPDPVIELDRGDGMTEVITESEANKCIQFFDINPHKKYTAEERARMKRQNDILTGLALIPTATCLTVAIGYMAFCFEAFIPVALSCFGITAFILGINAFCPKK